MTNERMYLVTFDTLFQRVQTSWGFLVSAHNKPEAKDKAFDAWHSKENKHQGKRKRSYWSGDYIEHPHMYHVDAKRVLPGEHDVTEDFFVLESHYYSWGYRG